MNLDRFPVRAVVGPVTAAVADTVDRVIDEDAVDDLIAELDARCAPPWCVYGVLEADDWDQVMTRVRGWHFT